MIRINLLPSKAAKKRKAPASLFRYVAVGLVLVMGVGLYAWYDSLSTDLRRARNVVRNLERDVKDLKEIQKRITEIQRKSRLLRQQNAIFEKLRAGWEGPPNMMMFLAYVMSNPEDTLSNRDELKALEAAGWKLDWNPRSVWLTRFEEDEGGIVLLEGEARHLDDVSQLTERLKTGVYFVRPEPLVLEREYQTDLEVAYVRFQIEADLNYKVEPPESEPEAKGPQAPTPTKGKAGSGARGAKGKSGKP